MDMSNLDPQDTVVFSELSTSDSLPKSCNRSDVYSAAQDMTGMYNNMHVQDGGSTSGASSNLEVPQQISQCITKVFLPNMASRSDRQLFGAPSYASTSASSWRGESDPTMLSELLKPQDCHPATQTYSYPVYQSHVYHPLNLPPGYPSSMIPGYQPVIHPAYGRFPQPAQVYLQAQSIANPGLSHAPLQTAADDVLHAIEQYYG